MKHAILNGDIPKLAAALPPFPPVLRELLQVLEEDSASLEALVRIVRTDPVISSAALSAANRLRRIRAQADVSDLFTAASIIGTSQLHRIAVTAGINRFLSTGSNQLFFYEHSVAVAIIAQELAMLAGVSAGEAYTSGILHDIGQLAFYIAAPDDYRALRGEYDRHGNLLTLEFQAFGRNHCELGYLLGQHWELPPAILQAIASHHQTANGWKNRLHAIVNLAETLSNALDMPYSPHNRVRQVNSAALQYLGLRWDTPEMADLFARCRARFAYFSNHHPSL